VFYHRALPNEALAINEPTDNHDMIIRCVKAIMGWINKKMLQEDHKAYENDTSYVRFYGTLAWAETTQHIQIQIFFGISVEKQLLLVFAQNVA
jgi:hypothetical protein